MFSLFENDFIQNCWKHLKNCLILWLPIVKNMETTYDSMSLLSYAVIIITYEQTNGFSNDTQLELLNRTKNYLQSISTTFSNEILYVQILEKTKEKDLVMETQQLCKNALQSLSALSNSSTTANNASDSSYVMESIVSYKNSLMSQGK